MCEGRWQIPNLGNFRTVEWYSKIDPKWPWNVYYNLQGLINVLKSVPLTLLTVSVSVTVPVSTLALVQISSPAPSPTNPSLCPNTCLNVCTRSAVNDRKWPSIQLKFSLFHPTPQCGCVPATASYKIPLYDPIMGPLGPAGWHNGGMGWLTTWINTILLSGRNGMI